MTTVTCETCQRVIDADDEDAYRSDEAIECRGCERSRGAQYGPPPAGWSPHEKTTGDAHLDYLLMKTDPDAWENLG